MRLILIFVEVNRPCHEPRGSSRAFEAGSNRNDQPTMSEIKEAVREAYEPRTVDQLFMYAIVQMVRKQVPDAREDAVREAVDELVEEGELEYVDDDQEVVRSRE